MEKVNIQEILLTPKATAVKEAIVNRLTYVAAVKGCDNPEKIREVAKDFLDTLPEEAVKLGADVVLRKHLNPFEGEYALETERLVLVWGKNTQTEARHPNVLWVHVKRATPKSLSEKAQEFFTKRIPGLTEKVISELFEIAFDGDSMVVCPHSTIESVIRKMTERPGGRFALQKVDRDGNVAVNHPLAYLVGNRVYLYLPGTEGQGRPWTFKV